MHPCLRITAPSRLHFGLLRFQQAGQRHYGGLGLMLDEPRCVLELCLSDRLRISGSAAAPARAAARQALKKWPLPEGRQVAIHIDASPPRHVGLGSGTQLALAVAAGIHRLGKHPPATITDLAQAVGRGLRSAVGSHGFARGGLIWETGYGPGQVLGQLSKRLELPAAWRVLLLWPRGVTGLHGTEETRAFEQLGPVPPQVTRQLKRLAAEQILPAAEQADFAVFAEGVYQFGRVAGDCFARIQGGPYASPQISARIAKLRQLGIAGAGQSSWGPTVFAVLPSAAAADKVLHELGPYPQFANMEILVTRPSPRGAHLASSPLPAETP